MPKGSPINIRGIRFGRLIALEPTDERRNGVVWLCICDCGNEHKASIKNLKNGDTKSCGCLFNETRRGKQLPDGKADFNNLLSTYKSGAKKRDLSFDLNEDEFRKITSQSCHYCNSLPVNQSSRKKILSCYPHNGIDRIDSLEGYTLENCIPCCSKCNKMKMDLGYDEFLQLIEKIYKFRVETK